MQTKQTTTLRPGSFGHALLKFQITEELAKLTGDTVTHSQIRIGLMQPSTHDELIRELHQASIDGFDSMCRMIGTELVLKISKYLNYGK